MIVRVYTDGASSPNGHGGWAALLAIDGKVVMGRYGGAKNITNNIMELQGLVEGMKLIPLVQKYRCKNCGVVDFNHDEQPECEVLGTIMRPAPGFHEVTIVSDSQYCVKGAKEWLHGWKQNGWKTKDKKPVKNQELWEEVDKLARLTAARFEWVKGHNGDAGNELADEWAGAGKLSMYKCKELMGEAQLIPGLIGLDKYLA